MIDYSTDCVRNAAVKYKILQLYVKACVCRRVKPRQEKNTVEDKEEKKKQGAERERGERGGYS